MKKSNVSVAFLLCIVMLNSCNRQPKKTEVKRFSYALGNYKKDFPEYKYRYDSLNKEGYLEYIESDKLNEILVFDSNEIIRYYVYYNTSLNKVRYSLEYSQDGKVVQESGKPVYLTSEFFGSDVGVRDSFGVFINMATPPYFKSSFTIYSLKGNLYDSMYEYTLQKSHTVLFVGTIGNETQKNYAVITKITNPFDSAWIRIDTAYFSINK